MRTRRSKAEDVGAVYHCISRIVGADYLLEGEREKEVFRNQIWWVADCYDRVVGLGARFTR